MIDLRTPDIELRLRCVELTTANGIPDLDAARRAYEFISGADADSAPDSVERRLQAHERDLGAVVDLLAGLMERMGVRSRA